MAEELLAESIEEASTEAASEEPETEEVIDLNARLLEVMVERTELLEKLLSGSIDAETARHQLETIKMPSLEKRRRRKTT
jgi:hypothetical protein